MIVRKSGNVPKALVRFDCINQLRLEPGKVHWGGLVVYRLGLAAEIYPIG